MQFIVTLVIKTALALIILSLIIGNDTYDPKQVLYLEGEDFYHFFGLECGDTLVFDIKSLVKTYEHLCSLLLKYDLLPLFKLLYLRVYATLTALWLPLLMLCLQIYLIGNTLKYILLNFKKSPRKLHALLLRALRFLPYLMVLTLTNSETPVLSVMLILYVAEAVLVSLCCALS